MIASHKTISATKLANDVLALMGEVDAAEAAGRGAEVCRAIMALAVAIKTLRASLVEAEDAVARAQRAIDYACGFDETRRAEEVLWAEEGVKSILADTLDAYINWRV